MTNLDIIKAMTEDEFEEYQSKQIEDRYNNKKAIQWAKKQGYNPNQYSNKSNEWVISLLTRKNDNDTSETLKNKYENKGFLKFLFSEKVRNLENIELFWGLLKNLAIPYIAKTSYQEFVDSGKTISNILDENNIEYSLSGNSYRCACPLCESDNNTTFAFNDEVFYCFKCLAKGNTFQLYKLLK